MSSSLNVGQTSSVKLSGAGASIFKVVSFSFSSNYRLW